MQEGATRFVRFGPPGRERPGVVDRGGTVRDLSSHLRDLSDDELSSDRLARLGEIATDDLPIVPAGARLGPPVGGIGKVIGVGLNYRDHAAELDLKLPVEPTLFLKATTSLSGPDDGVAIPVGGRDLDWEVELAVVIGLSGVYLDERRAMDHVAGYCVGIDFSERHFQFHRGGQGFKGKSADGFGPLGPWFVPRGDVPDPHALRLSLSVNGEARQDGSTADLIFGIAELVAYASRFMSLRPGDVILTGTPAGVGMGRKPPSYLVSGDRVEATITGLGTQRHVVRPPVFSGQPGGALRPDIASSPSA